MKKYKVGGYVRISKKTAERFYNQGKTIYLCPNKLRPGFYWSPEVAISKGDIADDGVQRFASDETDFENIVNEYAYYNCGNCAGRYPAFYVKECCYFS